MMKPSLNIQQKEFALPGADHLHESFEFSALHTGVDAEELLAEHFLEGFLVFHQRDCFQKAAWQFDPKEAVSLGGALAKLASVTWGHALLAVVAAGLLAFGLFGLAQARWRDV